MNRKAESRPIGCDIGWNRELLAWLHRLDERRETGALKVSNGSTSRELHFRDGSIVGARTSVDRERLGELLIAEGRITRQHFEDASIFVRHGWRLGRILVELGVLEASEVVRAVHRQAIEIARAALREQGAEIRFDKQSEPFVTLEEPLTTVELLMEGARSLPDPEAILTALRADRRPYRARENWARELRAPLTPEDVYVISRFQEGATLESVLQATSGDVGRVARTLVGLLYSGLLVATVETTSSASETSFAWEVETMFRKLERMDPWRAIGLARDADTRAARDAFRKAVQRYHPDRHHRMTDPELKKKLSSICHQFTDAFTCLTTALRIKSVHRNESVIPLASTYAPSSRSDVSPTTSAPQAETRPAEAPARAPEEPAVEATARVELRDSQGDFLLQEARRALASSDPWRAIQLLQRRLELSDEESEAHFLLGRALSMNPHWGKDAERSFLSAIRIDPWRTEYYQVLAQFYEEAGLHHRALRLVEQAKAMGYPAEGVPARAPQVA